jgi:DNA-binding LytR/AlgR family response regulator
MRMTCIIVDDEPLAQKGMQSFVEEIPFLELLAVCDNAIQALDAIRANKVDLIFLDIRMPKISGLDFLKSLDHRPLVIITTAYPDFALASYDLSVIDYIVKPIPFDRFMKAVNRAKDYYELAHDTSSGRSADEFCFIKCENRYEKIYYDELVYVEGMQNYVVLHASNRRLISYLTLKSIEDHLPSVKFLKINKSAIISLSKIDSITGNVIRIGAHTFTIGRPYREKVMDRVLGGKLVKRK